MKTCDELDLWLSFCLLSSVNGLHEVQMNYSIQHNLIGGKNKTEELGSNLKRLQVFVICSIFSHFVFRRHCWFNTYKQQFSESGFLPDRLPIVVLTKAESEVDKPDEQTTSLEDSNRNKDVKRPNLTGSPHLSNLFSSLDKRSDSTEFDWFWLDLTALSPRYVPYFEPRSIIELTTCFHEIFEYESTNFWPIFRSWKRSQIS